MKRTSTTEETPGDEVSVAEGGEKSQIDPLGLAQDTVPISRQLGGRPGAAGTRLTPPTRITRGGDAQNGDSAGVQVFRVQLTMVDTYSDARRALAVAQEIFDQPVTMDYEVPYYKLRVGEFPTRKEAELYLQRAKGAGYGNSWVMVATVAARQIQPLYQGADSVKADTVSR